MNKGTVLCWGLIALGVYTIFPFLFLAQYNQPSADDFTLALRDSSTSLPVVLRDVYANWSGRYLAPVFSRLNPLIYSPSGYKVFPIILILGFVASTIILVRQLFKSRYSFIEILALSALFIHLVFSQTPSISEAFYWFSGSCIYQTANILTLLLIAVLIRLRKSSTQTTKVFFTCLAALICIIIIGCNEISMIIVFFILLGLSVNEYRNTMSINYSNLILLFVCLVCGMVVFFSPGNLSRIDDPVYYNKSPLWTVLGAGSLTLLYLLKGGTSILSVSLVYFIFILKKPADLLPSQKKNVRIKSSVFYFVLVLISLQVIIIYMAGGGNLGRVENNVFIFVIVGYFFNLHLFINNYLRPKIAHLRLSSTLVVFSILFFLFNVFDIENNTSSAYIDIVSGRAKKYKAELEERLVLGQKSQSDTCYVPALSVTPKSLFVTDIRLPNDSMFLWINIGYAGYHKTCFLFPSDSLPLVEPNFEIIRHLGKEIRRNIVKKEAP